LKTKDRPKPRILFILGGLLIYAAIIRIFVTMEPSADDPAPAGRGQAEDCIRSSRLFGNISSQAPSSCSLSSASGKQDGL